MPYNYKILREFKYANIEASDAIETKLLKLTKSVIYTPKLQFSGQTEARDLSIKKQVLDVFDSITTTLYYMAFINFIKVYDGVFDMAILNSGNYSNIEIESVMKGYEIHKNMS